MKDGVIVGTCHLIRGPVLFKNAEKSDPSGPELTLEDRETKAEPCHMSVLSRENRINHEES